MAKLFVSYARANKAAVDELVEHLGILGWDVWVDTTLRGGQDWWEVILAAIADCDAFLVAVSRAALSSEACDREFEWAVALNKPLLPVAIEVLPGALPARISTRHVVDYSERGHRAALALAGALTALPPAPSLPDPMPAAPAVPLSYLTELIDLVRSRDPLDSAAQQAVVVRLEAALRSVDPVERQGARDVLDAMLSRGDLTGDTRERATQLCESPTAQLMTYYEDPVDESIAISAHLRAGDGTVIPVPPNGLRIGRLNDNDVVIDNPKVSRHHAIVVPTPDGVVLRDLGSANGTFVAGTRVTDNRVLGHGDLIRVSDRSWTFELLESVEG